MCNNQNIKKEFISNCISKDYIPLDLTVTFLRWKNYNEFDDVFMIQDFKKDKDLTSLKIDKIATVLETILRKVLNKVTVHLVGTKNYTRNNHFSKIPFVFYNMEKMKQYVRLAMVQTVKGSENIHQLHYHGLILVHPDTKDKIKDLLNEGSLRAIIGSISSTIQGIKIGGAYNVNDWFNYMNKGIEKADQMFYYAYGGFFPGKLTEALERMKA